MAGDLPKGVARTRLGSHLRRALMAAARCAAKNGETPRHSTMCPARHTRRHALAGLPPGPSQQQRDVPTASEAHQRTTPLSPMGNARSMTSCHFATRSYHRAAASAFPVRKLGAERAMDCRMLDAGRRPTSQSGVVLPLHFQVVKNVSSSSCDSRCGDAPMGSPQTPLTMRHDLVLLSRHTQPGGATAPFVPNA